MGMSWPCGPIAEMKVESVDPQGEDALALLREAAVEARRLYPESRPADGPWPTNGPASEWLCYLIGYVGGQPAACGALRPLEEGAAEVKRMFVRVEQRKQGLGREILNHLLRAARQAERPVVRLETGFRQPAAMSLYESHGFRRIPPFNEHIDDPYAVCFEMELLDDTSA